MASILLLLTVACVYLGAQKLRAHHERPPAPGPVAGTETWTVEEIDALRQGSVEISGEARFRRRVGLVATARPGPDGPLTAHHSGVECLWWRTETIRQYVELVDGERVNRSERVGHHWSREPFTLADETGEVLVWPDGADVVGAEVVGRDIRRYEPEAARSTWSELLDKDSTTAVVTTEYALVAGRRLFVQGEAHDQLRGLLSIGRAADGGPFVISTEPETSLRDRAGRAEGAAAKEQLTAYALFACALASAIAFYLI